MNPILLTLMAAFIFLMIPLTIYFLFIRTCGSAQGSGQGHHSSLPTGAHSLGAQWQQWRPSAWTVLILPMHFTRVTATNILGYVHIPPATMVRVQRVFRRFSMASHGPSNDVEANRYELSFGFGLPPGSTAGVFNPACPPDILPAHVAAEAGVSRYKLSPGIGAAAEGPPTHAHPTASASGPSRPAAAHTADAF
ncbi:hypothetical protein C8R46DRAFT_1101906 [Mycena filopes]|nr:hypothetical protein C8R46DRAFT_1101906 [Mycena filopes]